jgi:hypothetical protein
MKLKILSIATSLIFSFGTLAADSKTKELYPKASIALCEKTLAEMKTKADECLANIDTSGRNNCLVKVGTLAKSNKLDSYCDKFLTSIKKDYQDKEKDKYPNQPIFE